MNLVQIDVDAEFKNLHKYFSEGKFPELIRDKFTNKDLQALKFQLSDYQNYMIDWHYNEVDLDKFNVDVDFCLQYIDTILLDVKTDKNGRKFKKYTTIGLGIIFSLGGIAIMAHLLLFSNFPRQIVTTGDQLIVKKSNQYTDPELSDFRSRQNALVENYVKTDFLKRTDSVARIISLDVVDSLKWSYANSNELVSAPALKAYHQLNSLTDKKLIELKQEIDTKAPSHTGPKSEDEEKVLDAIVSKYNVSIELVEALN
jgi:hypothetical protein